MTPWGLGSAAAVQWGWSMWSVEDLLERKTMLRPSTPHWPCSGSALVFGWRRGTTQSSKTCTLQPPMGACFLCLPLFCWHVSAHAQVCCISGADQEHPDRSSRVKGDRFPFPWGCLWSWDCWLVMPSLWDLSCLYILDFVVYLNVVSFSYFYVN